MQVFRSRSTSDFVFLNKRGRPWTTNAVRLRIKRLKDKLGLPEDVCAYLFRHTFGIVSVIVSSFSLTKRACCSTEFTPTSLH